MFVDAETYCAIFNPLLPSHISKICCSSYYWTGNPDDGASHHSTSASIGSDYDSWAQTGAQPGMLEPLRIDFLANWQNIPFPVTLFQLGNKIQSSIQGVYTVLHLGEFRLHTHHDPPYPNCR